MKQFVVISFLILSSAIFAFGQKTSTVALFPVPCKINELKVRMTSTTAMRATTIELRNFIGKKLQTVISEGKSEVEFSEMRQYPEGVYVVLIKDKSGKIVESEKFIIAK